MPAAWPHVGPLSSWQRSSEGPGQGPCGPHSRACSPSVSWSLRTPRWGRGVNGARRLPPPGDSPPTWDADSLPVSRRVGTQVQSFLRGWLCRRKWKTIIQDYIRSPHADSMRKRNQVVFSMLEAEAEYVQQLHILVNNFLRPLRMAASSKKPPITHDDVSSIFLNR